MTVLSNGVFFGCGQPRSLEVNAHRRVSRIGTALKHGGTVAAMVIAIAICGTVATAAEHGAYIPRDFGARGDGQAKDTAAIQAAIDAAAKAGGGTVRLTAGRYLCGTLHLRSHLTFRLESGATLAESRDDRDFDPRRLLPKILHTDEETGDFRMALLAGDGVEDIAIEGHGLLDGNHVKRGGPKPIALKNCRHVTIRDITVRNSPNYSVSLLGCDHVDIDGVTVYNSLADGIDPDCCRYVRIANCCVDAHDDAICLKSSPALEVLRPTEYVTVTNCVLSTDCNYFKMGTESSGAFRRIAFSNCAMAPRTIIDEKDLNCAGIAIESVDGADIDGVVVSNVTMEKVNCPIFIRLGNRGRGQKTPTPGAVRNVSISNVIATDASIASSITGIPGYPVRDVTLSHIRTVTPGQGPGKSALNVPEMIAEYPDPDMFGWLPATGLYVRHAVGLTMRDIQVCRQKADPRAIVVADDLADAVLDDLRADGSQLTSPAVWLNSSRRIEVRHSRLANVPAAGAVRETGKCLEIRRSP